MLKTKVKVSFVFLVLLLGASLFFVFSGEEEKEEISSRKRESVGVAGKEKEKTGVDIFQNSENILKIGWMSDVHLGTNCHGEKMPTLADEFLEETLPQFKKEKVEMIM